MSSAPSLCALAVALACALTPVHAEDAPIQQQTLDTIKVTANSAPAAGVSMKLPLALREIPQTVTIVDRERIDQQRLLTLDDVMAQTPGVTLQPGTMLRTGYFVHGFSVDSLMLDGIPASGWNEALTTEDMATYERVEVLRGAGGLMQGTGNPSASINLVRKRPTETPHVDARWSVGTWSQRRGDVDISGPLTADHRLRGRFVVADEDRGYAYRDTHRRKKIVYGTVEWNLTPDTVLAVGAKWQRLKDDAPYMGLPRYRDGGMPDVSYKTYPGSDWSRRDWNTLHLFAEVKNRFADGWEWRLAANHFSGDSRFRYASAYGAIDRTTGRGSTLFGGAYRFGNDETDLDAYLTGHFSLFGRDHELVAGANLWRVDTDQDQAALPGLGQPVDLATWWPGSVSAPAWQPYSGRQSTHSKQYGGYVAVRFHLSDDVTWVVGGRESWWRTNVTQRHLVGGGPALPAGRYSIDKHATPHTGLLVDVTPGWTAYASYASIFKPQNYLQASGAVIKPMTGNNIELGIKGDMASGALNASFALYRTRQKNRAQEDLRYPCTSASCYYVAQGEVEARGVEAELDGRIDDRWTLSAGYTYTATRYLRDQDASGSFASFTPRHLVKLWTHYRLPWQDDRWTIGAGIQTQSKAWTDTGGLRLHQGGYTLVNAMLGYRLRDDLDLSLNLNNLLDRRYLLSFNSVAWNNWYGDSRNAMLTLHFHL